MIQFRFGVVLVAATLALTGCKDEAREQINETFDAYITALRNHDGAAAVELMDERYFEDMDAILNAAKFATREQVWKMRPSERARIVAIRNRLTKAELKGLDGKGLMKMSIDKDDTEEGDTPDFEVTLGEIRFKPPRATAEVIVEGFITLSTRLEFIEVNHVWKLNPACFDEKFDKAVEKLAVRSGYREDTIIKNRESRISGKTVTEAIWDPPR